MSEPSKSQTDVRPYAVHDALATQPAHPRVVIHTSPSAAVSHVVGARFTATALNAMEVLALTAQGVQVEDPRGSLPRPAAEPSIQNQPPVDPYLPAALISAPHPDLLAALGADDRPAVDPAAS